MQREKHGRLLRIRLYLLCVCMLGLLLSGCNLQNQLMALIQTPIHTNTPSSTVTPTPIAIPTQTTASTPTPTQTLIPTSTPSPTAVQTRTPKPSQVLWRGDLHIHTVCSGGENTYEEIIQKALKLHFDFIAITDHSAFIWESCQDTLKKCKQETRLLCIPSEEQWGAFHIVALGIQGDTGYSPNPPLQPQVEAIHRQGGWAIVAHPYSAIGLPGPQDIGKYTEEYLVESGIDAWECARGTLAQNQKLWGLAGKYNIPCVYVSDAHRLIDLGKLYTICSVPINSFADLKAALLGKKCKMN